MVGSCGLWLLSVYCVVVMSEFVSDWEVVSCNRSFESESGELCVVISVWVRQFQMEGEFWGVLFEGGEYRVVYDEEKVSVSVWDLVKNWRDLSWNGGLSFSFSAGASLDVGEAMVVESFDSYDDARSYVEDQLD